MYIPFSIQSALRGIPGLSIDGVGYGTAACKRPAAGPWPVTVE